MCTWTQAHGHKHNTVNAKGVHAPSKEGKREVANAQEASLVLVAVACSMQLTRQIPFCMLNQALACMWSTRLNICVCLHIHKHVHQGASHAVARIKLGVKPSSHRRMATLVCLCL
jgi:hypothetical protein